MKNPRQSRPMEMWGGIECSVTRIGDVFYNQIEQSGHASRIQDLEMFAELGITAIRYPVLWERTSPSSPDSCDWRWSDERLDALRKLGIRPIAGLLHHGSGPAYTSLIDPAFPEKLAGYARSVAERYPWVQDYTPINEPLTTARFSGLYGFWYPHARDDRAFGLALVNQCRGIALAMREIRKVNPQARLIQTEDLGRVWSTRHMAYQADFENERRWLSLDILYGRLVPDHPMWRYLEMFGLTPEMLSECLCPPDIIGINHYLTSERFLDEHLERYPQQHHGGNFRERYADVEAVRVGCDGPAGPKLLLEEAWERYGSPMAVTECHLNCSREEQMRWLREVWDSAQELREEGVDMRAVTAWSLLGSFDWDSLMMQSRGHYESGVYDLRCPTLPRPTALAGMIRELAQSGTCLHPILDVPGWWHRPECLRYFPDDPQPTSGALGHTDPALRKNLARPLLITGATGTLGSALARTCVGRGISFHLLTRRDMDITDVRSVEKALEMFRPWAVINAAGYVRVDDAEIEPEICRRVNTEGPLVLAKACAQNGVSFVTVSSDLVFDGNACRPYLESDRPRPLNVYGKSKLEAERLVLDALSSALIIRTSAFFGPWDRSNFLTVVLARLRAGEPFFAAMDATVSPTYVPDLVNAVLDLLIDGESGIRHIANSGAVTWSEFARYGAQRAGLDANLICPMRTKDLNLPAPRPLYSVLESEKACIMPTIESALDRYFDEAGKLSPLPWRERDRVRG